MAGFNKARLFFFFCGGGGGSGGGGKGARLRLDHKHAKKKCQGYTKTLLS